MGFPPGRLDQIRLRDSRILAWYEWGPSDGFPVIFCTGAAMSGSLPFGTEHLEELRIRLLSVDRPGLGSSDRDPDKNFDSWVADTRELGAAAGLDGPAAVGFSQGAPFAFALAAERIVRAVAIVSGQDELSHPSMQPLLHPDVAAMVAALCSDAAAFERRFAEIATAAGLLDLILSMSSDRDRALYTTEPFRTAFQRCLGEGFRQGPDGYARDLANALLPWPFDLEKISVPVDLWYGLMDTSVVHSPDFGVTLASRLPAASRVADPHEGGSILWTRSREILAALKRRASV